MADFPVIDKFRLKGNASFSIREGWLSKGLQHVAEDPETFLRDDATEILGVGSAMVKSIRFWMIASGLATEPNAGRRVQTLTEMGELILKEDRYFEDYFSLCMVHYNIATNPVQTTVWYLLFNFFTANRFKKTDMEDSLNVIFEEMIRKDYAYSSFKDDCGTALRTYVSDDNESTPEDNTQSPLASLGLFSQIGSGLYEATAPSRSKLHPQMVLYVILKCLQDNHADNVSLDKLLNDSCNVGRVFHLNAYQLLGYLDELQTNGDLTIQRTAGLNIIYPKNNLTSLQVAENYYKR